MLAGLLIPILGLIAWACLHAHEPEPSYRGKALSAWMRDLGHSTFEPGGFAWDDWPLMNAPQNPEAAQAVRRIGSAGFPYLLNALTNTDPAWKMKMARVLPWPLRNRIRLTTAAAQRGRAVLAFDALGTEAESVTPELTRALYDYPTCKAAAAALSAVGPRGWTVLTQAISSTNEWTAISAVWALANRRAAVPGTIEALMSAATNRFGTVSAMANWALGKIGRDKEHVIPFLMTALGSTNAQARFGAMFGIGWFGTNAICAVPLLLEALQDREVTIRDGAIASLKQIDPEAAAKAGAK
jgi:HEAT repeat protein